MEKKYTTHFLVLFLKKKILENFQNLWRTACENFPFHSQAGIWAWGRKPPAHSSQFS